jgi:uncharacterized protein
MRFAGYAAIFDAPDRGGDIVRKGAFAGALATDIPLFWQHDARRPVGVIEQLAEDARGLRVIARVDEPKAAELISSGRVKGLSFGYRVRVADHRTYRELKDVELIEISLVNEPMQPLARVHAVEL